MNDGSQLVPVPQSSLDSVPMPMIWPRATASAPGTTRPLPARAHEPTDRARMLKAAAEARKALEDAVIAAAVAAQRARSLTFALEEALTTMAAPDGSSAKPTPIVPETREHPTDALSPREKEVLALVAEGRSNKAIAAALYVSPNTVKTHVASLLNKLHVDSRVQLAAIAARRFAY